MGVMRFLVQPPGRVDQRAAERAYLAGPDKVAWHCRVKAAPNAVVIERATSDSGTLHIPWHVEGYGEVVLSTGTLAERAAPYQLAVELARGQVNQVRCQTADWQTMGLAVPDQAADRLRDAIRQFARAATSQHEPPQAAEYAGQPAGGLLYRTGARGSTPCFDAVAVGVRREPR
jgi:hypothetical protein